MKTFKPTYLYLKIHKKTGLMYFGKTFANVLKKICMNIVVLVNIG